MGMCLVKQESCIVFGVSEQTINTYLVLLNMDAIIRRAVVAGIIDASTAVQTFAGMPPEDRIARFTELGMH